MRKVIVQVASRKFGCAIVLVQVASCKFGCVLRLAIFAGSTLRNAFEKTETNDKHDKQEYLGAIDPPAKSLTFLLIEWKYEEKPKSYSLRIQPNSSEDKRAKREREPSRSSSGWNLISPPLRSPKTGAIAGPGRAPSGAAIELVRGGEQLPFS